MVSILLRMVVAAPVISSTVSPRTLSAIRKPPICEGVALPDMTISKACSAWLWLSERPDATIASKALRSIMSPFMRGILRAQAL
jgi:hypothetical protein